MSPFYDDNISRYLWYFYRMGRLDDIGLRAIITAHDRYATFVGSGLPRDRHKTWEAVHLVCEYLSRQEAGNDGLN